MLDGWFLGKILICLIQKLIELDGVISSLLFSALNVDTMLGIPATILQSRGKSIKNQRDASQCQLVPTSKCFCNLRRISKHCWFKLPWVGFCFLPLSTLLMHLSKIPPFPGHTRLHSETLGTTFLLPFSGVNTHTGCCATFSERLPWRCHAHFTVSSVWSPHLSLFGTNATHHC